MKTETIETLLQLFNRMDCNQPIDLGTFEISDEEFEAFGEFLLSLPRAHPIVRDFCDRLGIGVTVQ